MIQMIQIIRWYRSSVWGVVLLSCLPVDPFLYLFMTPGIDVDAYRKRPNNPGQTRRSGFQRNSSRDHLIGRSLPPQSHTAHSHEFGASKRANQALQTLGAGTTNNGNDWSAQTGTQTDTHTPPPWLLLSRWRGDHSLVLGEATVALRNGNVEPRQYPPVSWSCRFSRLPKPTKNIAVTIATCIRIRSCFYIKKIK